ncbi:cytochrome P450 9e2-like isoform X1 [Chrysoperla carnea]|uniref:cytochrome P450 9e2-like isoform X1 n=1 Tax=Chrysoperla carnea TaxID=189513 RepID=UPI001D066A17|nr:cytochrome P450 9e2-like isoform X1 [Chrysoperla carnea]
MWLITFALVGVFYFYWNFIRPLNTWKNYGIPYIKGWPLVGNFLKNALKRESFGDAVISMYKAFPNEPYCGSFVFSAPRLLIRDANLLKDIGIKDFDHFTDHTKIFFGDGFDPIFDKNLFSLDGQNWRDMRATLSPAFTGSKMRGIFVLMNECGNQLVNYLNDKIKAENNQKHLELELKDLFTRFTNDIIATTAFGIKVDSLKEPENKFYLMGREVTYFSTFRFFLMNFIPTIMRLLNIGVLSKAACDYFRNLVFQTISMRETQKIVRPDMLNILLQAKNGLLKNDDKGDDNGGFAAATEGKVGGKIRKLTDEDVTAQAFIFFLAGFDTVSTAMCFIVYELALNPDIQERLYSEINDALDGNPNAEVTYETLHKMKYLDMIISESLRKWPPAVFIDRECTKPYRLKANNGKEIMIPTDMGIVIPIMGIHRDPKYYPNPEKFDPERFSDENKSKINMNAYLPFGVGPRVCIGSRFALMETKILIVHLIRNFEVILTSKSTVPPRLSTQSSNMAIENGFNVGLKPRNF